MPLELNYYYGNEAEQFSFYRIPKILFTDARYSAVSIEAKVLYGLLLDRMALSVKNSWLDEEGRVYIIYTISDVMDTLGCAEQKANKLLSELDSTKGVGLIERKRRGLGKPNVIYVKNFLPKSQIQNCENHKSGNVKITSQELRKSQTNNTDLNHTEPSDTDLSIHPACLPAPVEEDAADRMDSIELYTEIVKENIEYEILLQQKPEDRDSIDGIVDLLVETICTAQKTVRIGQEGLPADLVKSRFLKLDGNHIEYVMDSLRQSTTKVRNIRAYLLTALYRSPATINAHYTAQVNHDLYGSGDG